MAAGLYILLMWGYMSLQSPQIYAAYTALIMSIALLFWVGEARVDSESELMGVSGVPVEPLTDIPVSPPVPPPTGTPPAIEPTLDASIQRLESLKADLTQQYAQFGRDQSSLNSSGLGTWHSDSGQRRCGK